MSKNKKLKIIGSGVIAVGIIGAGLYLMNEKPIVDKPFDQPVIASDIISFSNNGVVTLYDTVEGKETDTFDLKTLSETKEIQVDETVEVPEPTPTPEPTQTPESKPEPTPSPEESTPTETYKDFEKVEIVIKKGDFAWKIQKELTPSRDVGEMVALVSEANGGKPMHPIYPGEKLFFLKEKDGGSVSPEKKVETPVVTQVVEPTKVVEPVKTVVTKTVTIDKATYLFHKDEGERALYAYSDFDDEIYKITEVDNKLSVETVLQNKDIASTNEFMVTDGKAFFATKGEPKAQIIDLKNPANLKEIELDGQVSHWVEQDSILYYTFRDQVGKYDLTTNKNEHVLVGDESLDLVIHQDKVYVLNSFGEKTENSLLMQINPSDLNVDNILELKSNTSAILSKGQEEVLLVGATEKSKDLNGKEVETNKVSAVKLNTLALENSKWTIPFSKEAVTNDSYLYILKDKKVNIYPMNSVEPEKSIEVKGNDFVIMP